MSEDRLPDLFLEAVELDETARHGLIRRLERDEPMLAMELERLLATPTSARSPIDGSAAAAAGIELPAIDLPEAAPPPRVGPYRILRELGQGGMGRVFLAEQETPDFKRTVALKVIARPGLIKAGPEDDAVRRFRDEVRILASLDHPGIVRFLDGGRSREGIWFLAQEYVEGGDLVSWSRDRATNVRERLALFRTVVDAVACAHGSGVVHRDLKPQNVLVSADGRPRLLDFGISKLVDPTASEGGLVTRTDTRALTPAYASPEQLAGRPATVASDIYSLGVILYELLAGERPFAGMGSREELERAVRERDPRPPSKVAERPDRDHPDADLDAICMKALRKEPGERYATAAAFAEDVGRYLEGRPVEARRGGLRYRWGRVARRHRGRLVTAAALVVAAVSLLVALRTRSADHVPEPEIFPFSHLRAMPIPDLERRFAAAPEDVDAGAALALALAERRRVDESQILVNRLRQVPGRERDPLLDYVDATIAMERSENQRALVLFTRARDGARQGGRGELLPQIRAARGSALLLVDQPAEAAAEMKAAARAFREAGDDASLARVLNDLAIVELQRGELAHGEALLEASVRASQQAGTTLGATLCNLAILQGMRGRPDLAAERLGQAVALYRERGDDQRGARTAANLSEVLRDLGKVDEADARLAGSIAALEATGKPSGFLVESLVYRAVADLAAGKVAAMPAEIAEIERTAAAAADTQGAAQAHRLRGELAALAGDPAAAGRHFAEAQRLLLASGNADAAGELAIAWATAAYRAGSREAALAALATAVGPPAGQPLDAGTTAGFLGEALRARIAAERGEVEASRTSLDRLDPASAASPSLSRRLAFFAARAALAAAEHRVADAGSDLQVAIDAARRAGRRVDELELRLALAGVAEERGARARLAAEVEREAGALGLTRFASSAGALRVTSGA